MALEPLDVLDPCLACVLAGQFEHLIGHVEAVHLAAWADATRREKNVSARP